MRGRDHYESSADEGRDVASRAELGRRAFGGEAFDAGTNGSGWSGKKRPYMKPEKYDGKTSFETYLYDFENCAKYNRWDQEDKIAHLRWLLTGVAAVSLGHGRSFLSGELRGCFEGSGMEEKFQCELRCRRRNRGKSVRKLAHDIRRLMTLAYPGEKSALAEHIARDAFLSALDDPDFALKIRETEPADMEAALRYAQALRGIPEFQ